MPLALILLALKLDTIVLPITVNVPESKILLPLIVPLALMLLAETVVKIVFPATFNKPAS